MTTLLPAPFLFRFALPVPRMAKIPHTAAPWLRLPESCRLVAPSSLDSPTPFAELRAAWNDDGLAISVEVAGKQHPPSCDPEAIERSDGIRLWFDTRDTKSLHHATRFCQHFCLMPAGGGEEGTEPAIVPLPVPRAREDAQLPDADDVLTWSQIHKTGYQVEAWFPSEVLHGYDPSSQSRLGFFYHVHDAELGDQHFSVGPPFPVASDPSLWGTLALEK